MSGEEKVLVVDDIEAIRKMMVRAIQMGQYPVAEAANGLDALKLIANDKDIKLVFLDIVLPDIDGFTIMDKIRAIRDQHKRQIKVVFISGKNTKDDVVRAIHAGADDYLIKPVLSETLINKIQTLLGKKRVHEFARASVLFKAKILDSTILPDLVLTSVTEDSVLVRSSAGFKSHAIFSIESKELCDAIGAESYFQLRVLKSERQKFGLHELEGEFVGLHESVAAKIRGYAIRAAADRPEPAEQ